MQHAQRELRRLLSPNYAVTTITTDALLREPWQSSTALIVFPGGGDLGYCRLLNGEGNRRIREYVAGGGRYVGFCAGGYYGSRRCEFEVGDQKMEVVGNRELAFFPGINRGCVFKAFEYNSESGTRAAKLKIRRASLALSGSLPESFRCYVNGGGMFDCAEQLKDKGVEILAEYDEPIDVESTGSFKPAIVYCVVGEGAAVLTGPHPE